jgi:hypothetical protein
MRIPAVLVVSVIAVAFAWSYGPAWAAFGALAVATFAFVGIRQAMRSRSGDGTLVHRDGRDTSAD